MYFTQKKTRAISTPVASGLGIAFHFPDLGSHALQEGSHANLPIGIVLAEKHRDLTKTRHGRQVVFELVTLQLELDG